MGFLFAGAKKKVIPEFTGLQIQTAVNLLPIPILYGTPRTQMNIIYVNGFRAVAQSSGGGGKGLLTGGKGDTSGYKYFASFIGALGEGTIPALYVVFDNQATYTPTTAPNGKVFNLFTGSADQPVWEPLTVFWPNDSYNYPLTSFIGFFDWPLDSSATIPQLNFVVSGLFAGTCPLNNYVAPDGTEVMMDADPALCIYDLLTNERYGVPFPADMIDDATVFSSPEAEDPDVGDMALSTYCQAVGFGFSVALNNSEPAASILENWCKNMAVAPVWTGSKLKFIPYWDRYDGTNPGYDPTKTVLPLKYYQPDIQPVFDLTDVDYMQAPQGDDPVTISRIDISEVKNVVRVDFRDRFLLYNDSIAEAKDENMIETFGLRVDRTTSATEYSLAAYASMSANVQLKQQVGVRNTYEFRLGWQYCILEPMDVLRISDSILGLNQQPVRIASIEEDEKGVLLIKAREFQVGAGSTVGYPQESSQPPTFLQTNETAPPVFEPLVFEPTSSFLSFRGQPVPTIILGASGGTAGVSDPNWGGANVYVSTDDITYAFQGVLNQPSRIGELVASLPAYAGGNPDEINTLEVDLIQSNGILESVTPEQAASGLTVCVIVDPDGGFELLSYTVATLVGQNAYELTGLYRGLFGTVANCTHPAGAKFLRVDTQVFETALSPELVGHPLFLKLQSFNLWGQGIQDLSDCVAYEYLPNGQGQSNANNPIVLALLTGTPVDLATGSTTWNLDLGGSGACSPVGVFIDLN